MKLITNPDAIRSDCYRCGHAEGDECVLTRRCTKPLAQAQREHQRCMYWDEVKE